MAHDLSSLNGIRRAPLDTPDFSFSHLDLPELDPPKIHYSTSSTEKSSKAVAAVAIGIILAAGAYFLLPHILSAATIEVLVEVAIVGLGTIVGIIAKASSGSSSSSYVPPPLPTFNYPLPSTPPGFNARRAAASRADEEPRRPFPEQHQPPSVRESNAPPTPQQQDRAQETPQDRRRPPAFNFVFMIQQAVLGRVFSIAQPSTQHRAASFPFPTPFSPPPLPNFEKVPDNYAPIKGLSTTKAHASGSIAKLFKGKQLELGEIPPSPTVDSLFGSEENPGELCRELELFRSALQEKENEDLNTFVRRCRENLKAPYFDDNEKQRAFEYATICHTFKKALAICPEDKKTKLVRLFSTMGHECKVGCDEILEYDIIPVALDDVSSTDPVAFAVSSSLKWRQTVAREILSNFLGEIFRGHDQLLTDFSLNPHPLKHAMQLLNEDFFLANGSPDPDTNALDMFFERGNRPTWDTKVLEGHKKAFDPEQLKTAIGVRYQSMSEDDKELLLQGMVQIYKDLLEKGRAPFYPDITKLRTLCEDYQDKLGELTAYEQWQELLALRVSFEDLDIAFTKVSEEGIKVPLVRTEEEITATLYNKVATLARNARIVKQKPEDVLKEVNKLVSSKPTENRALIEALNHYERWETSKQDPNERLHLAKAWGFIPSFDKVTEFVKKAKNDEVEHSAFMFRKRLTVTEGELVYDEDGLLIEDSRKLVLGKTATLLFLALSCDVYTEHTDGSFVTGVMQAFTHHSKEQFSTLIDRCPNALRFAPESIRGSIFDVKHVVERDPRTYVFATPEVQKDLDVAKAAVENCYDRDFVRYVVQRCPLAIYMALPRFQADREIVLEALVRDPDITTPISDTLLQERKELFDKLRACGPCRVIALDRLVKDAPTPYRRDKEFMMALIRHKSCATEIVHRYIHPDLIEDDDIVLELMIRYSNCSLFPFAAQVQEEKEGVSSASDKKAFIERTPRAFIFAPPEVQQDLEVAKAAIANCSSRNLARYVAQRCPKAIEQAPVHFQNDEEIVLEALVRDPEVDTPLSQSLLEKRRSLILKLNECDSHDDIETFLKNVPAAFGRDREFMTALIRHEHSTPKMLLGYFHEDLIKDPEVTLELVIRYLCINELDFPLASEAIKQRAKVHKQLNECSTALDAEKFFLDLSPTYRYDKECVGLAIERSNGSEKVYKALEGTPLFLDPKIAAQAVALNPKLRTQLTPDMQRKVDIANGIIKPTDADFIRSLS